MPAGNSAASEDEDLRLALWCCYELHYRGFEDVDEDWEWHPAVLAFRGSLERRWLTSLRDLAGEHAAVPADAVPGAPAAAQAQRAQADAEYGHGTVRWPQVEHAFRQVIPQLEQAHDPLLADAWAGLARSLRYQKGRRDDRIAAAATSLYWDRTNKTAWAELADLASAAPHVPTLLDLFRACRAPSARQCSPR